MLTIRIRVYNHGREVYGRQMVVNTTSHDKALAVGIRIARKKRRELVLAPIDTTSLLWNQTLYEVTIC